MRGDGAYDGALRRHGAVAMALHCTRTPWYYQPKEDEQFGKVEASQGVRQ